MDALLRNGSLRFGFVESEPSTSECATNSRCKDRGYAIDAAVIACQLLKIDCTFEKFNEFNFGRLDETGNWTGLIRAVMDGRFDTAIPVLTPTYERHQVVQFSAAFFYFDLLLMTRMPDRVKALDWWSLFRSFSLAVWCSFVSSILIIILIHILIDFLPPRPTNVSSRKRRLDFATKRLLIALFAFIELVVTSTYDGVAVSNQMVVRNNVPFTDLDGFVDCVWERRCRLATTSLSYSFLERLFAQGAFGKSNRSLSDAIKSNPVLVNPSEEEIAVEILHNKNAYLTMMITEDVFSSLTRNRECFYYTVSVPYSEPATIPFRKEVKNLEKIDQIAHTFRQSGIQFYLRKRYNFEYDRCGANYIPASRPVLSMNAFCSALVLYASGVGAAGVFLLIERTRK